METRGSWIVLWMQGWQNHSLKMPEILKLYNSKAYDGTACRDLMNIFCFPYK
jgi:hypothetical protein